MPVTRLTRNSTRNTTNSTWAIHAIVPAIPPKPSTAATRATIKNSNAQYNMTFSFPDCWPVPRPPRSERRSVRADQNRLDLYDLAPTNPHRAHANRAAAGIIPVAEARRPVVSTAVAVARSVEPAAVIAVVVAAAVVSAVVITGGVPRA